LKKKQKIPNLNLRIFQYQGGVSWFFKNVWSRNSSQTQGFTKYFLSGIQHFSLWLCMTMYDYIWLCMTMFDNVWLCMTMYDYVWLYMTMHDYLWLYLTMTMFNQVWVCMTLYPVWPHLTLLALFGSVRPSLAPFGPVWSRLAPFGPVWPSLALFSPFDLIWHCMSWFDLILHLFAPKNDDELIFKTIPKRKATRRINRKNTKNNNAPQNEDQLQIKTTPKMWKDPKMKTTQKMEKKNKVNPKIQDSSKVNTYNYCHSTSDLSPWLLQQEWP